MIELSVLAFFPALMAFAAFSDLFTMTISNFVSLALVALFFTLAVLLGMPAKEVALHAAAGGLMLVVTFLMFARNWIGGGDAKLAAATAVWVGWDNLADYGFQAAIIGGLLTLLILQFRRTPMPNWCLTIGWLMRLHDNKAGVPYGIALAAAGLLVYPETSLWSAAAFA